eukprot:CAMPEP_0197439364 /NCGR_PEP_ID=MMETSP1175-20131217/6123_1 /TAXON_ID=1003142 /ORGANISM="Triceratium dubium, Strain CCMP147" /LENGTH=676 /DNA_ID=CAMNT_0042969271 /DNA_START=77 /DNA_END=2108 /DNA_ORIENTATION=-
MKFVSFNIVATLSIFSPVKGQQQPKHLRLHSSRRAASTIPAFPGAAGYGSGASGGRGSVTNPGTVIKVTSLSDSGAGTLRDAVAASGPRTVVFEVSGYIDLTTEISIDNSDITIAGQTSPGGITVRGSRIKVRASNVIVRGMRFRPGDDSVAGGGDSTCSSKDGFGIGQSLVEDVIFDHCSATWAMDENGSSWYTSSRTTISNCIFGEAISLQCQSDGGFGYLIGTGSTYAAPSKISLLRNVFISNRDRNPYVKSGATEIEVINNFGYNHKSAAFAFADDGTSVHVINNYYKHGHDSHSRASCYLHADGASLSTVYLSGNIDTCYRSDASQGGETEFCHKEGNSPVAAGEVANAPVFTGSGFTSSMIEASNVPGDLFPSVGAIHPSRDSIDERILSTANIDVLTCNDKGNGAVISDVNEVDYPPIQNVQSPADADGDGIPDSNESTYGLDPNTADSHHFAGSGYTYLEEYINSFYSVSSACSTNSECDDQDACTTDVCNTATGICENTVINCSDGDTCTTDSCDTTLGCMNTQIQCDDNDAAQLTAATQRRDVFIHKFNATTMMLAQQTAATQLRGVFIHKSDATTMMIAQQTAATQLRGVFTHKLIRQNACVPVLGIRPLVSPSLVANGRETQRTETVLLHVPWASKEILAKIIQNAAVAHARAITVASKHATPT